jgi:hypothetical protein
MTLKTMNARMLTICCLLAAGISRAAPTPSMPKLQEVCQILSSNLAATSADALDQAAARGLVRELEPRVSMVAGGACGSNVAPLAEARVFDQSFAFFRVAAVTSNLPAAFRAAFHQMSETNKSRLKGLILDLRFAGGFDYAAAAQLADYFLSSDRPLLDWQSGSARATLKTDAITVPVAMLVNAQTSGAAEALAAALRDADAGLILGGQTAGQASVFREFPLRDGGRLRVAVAPVKFGAGKTLSGGLTPDIAINTSLEDDRAYLRDPFKMLHPPQFAKKDAAKALEERRVNEAELIREQGEDKEPDEISSRDAPDAPVMADPVLARALDLLKGLAVVQPNRPE